MASRKTQFSKDLSNPSAGKESDLYKAITPLISGESGNEDMAGLNEDVRKGLVGLEYLTGLKQNTGETFYDKHPTQAVLSDALKHSLGIGAGVAGLGVASNMATQMRNMRKTEPASMSREKNPLDRKNHLESLMPKKDKPVSPDLVKLFGDIESDPQLRLQLIDRLGDTAASHPQGSFWSRFKGEDDAKKGLIDQYQKDLGSLNTEATATYSDPKQQQAQASRIKERRGILADKYKADLAGKEEAIKKILNEAHGHEGFQQLGKYVAPNQDQGIIDLILKRNFSGMDKDTLKSVLAQNLGIDVNSPRMRAIIDTGIERAKRPNQSGLMNSLIRHRTPLLAGAGIAAGGTGLYSLLKAIQNQAFEEDQVKDWKKTLLKSRGEFDKAEQV